MRLALLGVALVSCLAGIAWAGWQLDAQYDGGAGVNGYYSHGYGCPGHYSGSYYADDTRTYRTSGGSFPFVTSTVPGGYNVTTGVPGGYFGTTTGEWSTSSDRGISGYYSSGGGWGFNYNSGTGTTFGFGRR